MSYTTTWLVWIVMFFAIELPAAFNRKKGDTLSEHLWKWFSIKDKAKGWRVRRMGLTFTLVWIFIHLITGGWI